MANASPESFSDVIGLWPSRTELATDVSVPYGVIKQWHRRDSIPPEHWTAVVEAAERRNFAHVTTELLARLAARNRRVRSETAA